MNKLRFPKIICWFEETKKFVRHHSQDRPLSSVLVGGKTPGEACHPLTRGAMDKIDVEISSDRARQQGLDVIVIVGITFRSWVKNSRHPSTGRAPSEEHAFMTNSLDSW